MFLILRKRCFQAPPPPLPTLSHYSAPFLFQSGSAGPEDGKFNNKFKQIKN